MKPHSNKTEELTKILRVRHNAKFSEMRDQGQELAGYLKRLNGFEIADYEPLLDIEHCGRILVDAVLQVGHDYEKQVRNRVEEIKGYPEASTISGFSQLLRKKGIFQLIAWNSKGTEKDLLDVADFFGRQKVDTYSEMKAWLKSEEHRDSLLSINSGLGKNSTFKVANKTADYFRLLVGHWDAVAVDKGIGQILSAAKIVSSYSKKFNYKEKRAIVQLAALELNCRPIDLDHSIYLYYVNSKSKNSVPKRRVKKINKDFKYCFDCGQKIPRNAKYCIECGKRQV